MSRKWVRKVINMIIRRRCDVCDTVLTFKTLDAVLGIIRCRCGKCGTEYTFNNERDRADEKNLS